MMRNSVHNPDLLERLLVITGCEYISDLKQPIFQDAICDALEQIPADSFPAKDWLKAVSCLVSEHSDDRAAALHAQLLKHIGQALA